MKKKIQFILYIALHDHDFVKYYILESETLYMLISGP